MNDLKACAVCLSTDIKLYSIEHGKLKNDFQQISGFRICKGSGLPNYLCYQCTARLKSCIKFRDKCQQGHNALLEILMRDKQITKASLNECNNNLEDIITPLSYMNIDKVHFEQVTFNDLLWTKDKEDSYFSNFKKETIPVFVWNIFLPDKIVNTVNKYINVDENISNNNNNENEPTSTDDESHVYLDAFDSDHGTTESIADDDHFSIVDKEEVSGVNDMICKIESVKSSVEKSIEEEYALMIPMSDQEAKAIAEANKKHVSPGKYNCEICSKVFASENLLKGHMRMHDKHISGHYHCELCDYYYKTELLLNNHITEKHKYKYLCTKCPAVSFERILAKKHYRNAHYQNRPNEPQPSWVRRRIVRGKNDQGVKKKPIKKKKMIPKDFIVCTPIGHEEQYAIVQQRQHTKNYREAKYRCDLCFIGLQQSSTIDKHMKKHDPQYSGELQCDICKLYFKNHIRMYHHMTKSHRYKFSCEKCDYLGYDNTHALAHSMFHKNVKYKCPHCDQEFTKPSTRFSHVRIKHPSMHLCNLCGHSFISVAGLASHKRLVHTKEEIEISSTMVVHKSDPSYCADCDVQFLNAIAFDTHLGSSYKHTTTNVSTTVRHRRKIEGLKNGVSFIHYTRDPNTLKCEVCGIVSANEHQALKHHKSEHPNIEFPKKYMCDICGHKTKQSSNLISHMRTHSDEKQFKCPQCDRRFKQSTHLYRHLVVHTGEKRYACHICGSRFTQSSSRLYHINHVHFKIPYPRRKRMNQQQAQEEQTNTTVTSTTSDRPLCNTPADYLNAELK